MAGKAETSGKAGGKAGAGTDAGRLAATLTRADLADELHRAIGLSRVESAQFVEQVLETISDALIAGEHVKLSSFGSFLLRDKGLRIGRNPKTGVEVPIAPRRVLTFRPSQILRDQINAG